MLGMRERLYKSTIAFFLGILAQSTFVKNAYADHCGITETHTDFGCLPNDPVGFVQTFYGWGIGMLSFVAILFMIIGGYFIMASRGDPEKVAKGKSFIYYSIAGILLAILGFVFIEIVAGQILKIPRFN
jgi:hypothetical protein